MCVCMGCARAQRDRWDINLRSLTLDATAGHRSMWRKKHPPLTVFMDKRGPELDIPPDVIAVWKYCPFRSGVFGVVLFDPPFIVRVGGPDKRRMLHNRFGAWFSKCRAVASIAAAAKEFQRLAPRLCFKWGDTRDGPTLWGLLPLFRGWIEIHRREWTIPNRIRGQVYWVTFIKEG